MAHCICQLELGVQQVGKTLPAGQRGQQCLGTGCIACCGMPGDGPLGEGALAAAKAGAFTCGKHVWHVRGHQAVHLQAQAVIECAAQQLAHLGVGHQAKATCKSVAGQGFVAVAALHLHRLQLTLAECLQHMAGGAPVAVEEGGGLQGLGGPAWQLQGKGGQGLPWGLFGDTDDLGTRLAGGVGGRQQQGAGAGHHDALAFDGHTAFDERLQPTRTGHAGQCPAGEGQQQLACAVAQDEAVAVLNPTTFGIFQQQGWCVAGCGRATKPHHAGATQQADIRVACQRIAVLAGQGRQLHTRAVAPDLAAGVDVVVHNRDGHAAGCCSDGCRHTRRAGTNYQQITTFSGVHTLPSCGCVPVSTTMPSLHRVWQARRRRPSTSTRHSWQIPMPQKGARRSPVTEVRLQPGGSRARAAARLWPGASVTAVPSMTTWMEVLGMLMRAG